MENSLLLSEKIQKYFRPSPCLFTSKNDPKDLRMGDLRVNWQDNPEPPTQAVALIGYPDDEGIFNNGGRTGAALGPRAIREVFYKTTPHPLRDEKKILDLGDLLTSSPLTTRHEQATAVVEGLLKTHYRVITLGGGHDYGYPDGSAFARSFLNPSLKPIVINFDAHLDVRPYLDKINSGTPFFRLLEQHAQDIVFFEIGLQPQCNSKSHATWATKKGAHLLWWDTEDFNQKPEQVLEFIRKKIPPSSSPQKNPIYISLDIDALDNSQAPGCSQSWPRGFSFLALHKIIDSLHTLFDVRILGLYEVSPPLDQDSRTTKLASLFMHQFLFHTPRS